MLDAFFGLKQRKLRQSSHSNRNSRISLGLGCPNRRASVKCGREAVFIALESRALGFFVVVKLGAEADKRGGLGLSCQATVSFKLYYTKMAEGSVRLPARWRTLRQKIGPPAGPVILVWDLGVRAFHWSLVVAVSIAAFTGFVTSVTALEAHLIAGAAIACLIVSRIVWGALGSTHARFADFAFGPRAVLAHVRGLITSSAGRHLGHNPLGAIMVFTLLLVLATIVGTGIVALGGMFKQGPLAAFVSFATGRWWLGVHNALAVLLLTMIAMHVAGVAFESRRGRENLIGAMITGLKTDVVHVSKPPPVSPQTLRAAVILLSVGCTVVIAVYTLAARPVPGLPAAKLDPTYVQECGACHFAFPPSLATSTTWEAIINGLDRHFGENASLDSATLARLRTYLVQNAAEHFDTLAANRLRIMDPTEPLRITATPFWRRAHRAIADQVFADKRVGAKTSCGACHHDATSGLFAPQSIKLPEEIE